MTDEPRNGDGSYKTSQTADDIFILAAGIFTAVVTWLAMHIGDIRLPPGLVPEAVCALLSHGSAEDCNFARWLFPAGAGVWMSVKLQRFIDREFHEKGEEK